MTEHLKGGKSTQAINYNGYICSLILLGHINFMAGAHNDVESLLQKSFYVIICAPVYSLPHAERNPSLMHSQSPTQFSIHRESLEMRL